MPFPPSVKQEALVQSRRSCCVCQEFAGRATEVHHIIPEAEGGPETIDNAIVLCLRCHVEASHYNNRQPLGNKYSPSELRRLRDEWWEWCRKNQATPLAKHPISVSPETIMLPAGGKISFKVYNRDKNPWHQVWVKLTIDTPNIDLRDVSIEPEHPRRVPSGRLGPGEVLGDILRVAGRDQVGKKCITAVIASLDPGETRSFDLSSSRDVTILAGVWSFDTKPRPLIKKTDYVELSTPPLPEPFTLEQVTVLTKHIP